MRMHFLRNATFLLQIGQHQILVDPMLGPPGSLMSLTLLREPRRNPLVPLPEHIDLAQLAAASACVLTHCRYGHADHLDRPGAQLLAKHHIPVYAQARDRAYLQRRGLRVAPLKIGVRQPFLDGTILPVPAQHGYDWLHWLMGPGVGYVIEFPNEPSVYICGDTVLTPAVAETIATVQPAIIILPAGGARLDVGRPILMTADDVIRCIKLAPGRVVAMHMEALNHCPTTRQSLRQRAQQAGVMHKVLIPDDGALLQL
ncbi:MAG: MBL fold metallo-hydrolase [Chloroflexales bacterium]|nr:MBL fold metallo-hydrolase [Chloroflexales bacterium]